MGSETERGGDDILPGRKGCHPSPGVCFPGHPPGVFAFNPSAGMSDLFRALGWLILGALCVAAMFGIALAGIA